MAVKPHTDKVLRIESLQPYVDAGLILFHASHTTLREQLINFPNADHDDGPDCLEMLWQLAMGAGVAAGANAGGGADRRGERGAEGGQTGRGMSNLARRFGGQARRILNLGRR
jgi:hypothetical protein